jgi:predicted MFS family arabinose efflux permease
MSSRFLQLALIALAAAAASFSATTLSSLQESMRLALSLTDNQLAILQGVAIYLPTIVIAVPIGLLIDRYSRVRLLSVFAAIQIVGTLLTAFAPDFGVLVVARVLVGMMLVAISMTVCTMAPSLAEPAQRGRMIMMVMMAQCAGASAALLAGGKLAAIYSATQDDWRVAMTWLTVPLLAAFALTFFMRNPPKQLSQTQSGHVPLRVVFTQLWQYRAMLFPLTVGSIVVGLGDTAAIVWSVPLFSRTFGWSPDRVGAMVATVLLVGGFVGPFVGGLVNDYCVRTGGPRRAMSAMVVIATLHGIAGAFAVLPTPLMVGVALLAYMLINYVHGIVSTTLTAVVIPNDLLGSCFGIKNVAACIFVSLSPLIVSSVAGSMGGPAKIGDALALVCVVASAAGALLLFFGRKAFPSHAAAGEPLTRDSAYYAAPNAHTNS